MQWVKQEAVSSETGEVIRGRAIIALSPHAVESLTALFNESKRSIPNGMSKRDIENYMKTCGLDNVPPQRIEGVFNKHSVVNENDGSRVLNLHGFLAYYRDVAQSCENQVSIMIFLFCKFVF